MEPLPSDRKRAIQLVGVIVAGAVGTVLVAGLLWFLYKPESAPESQPDIEPAQETSATTPSVIPSQTAAETTGSVTPTVAPKPGGPTRAAKVAFRLGDAIYVAGEDGAGPKRIVRAPEAPFALSPDASKLAVVEAGTLKMVDVASGAAVNVGPAEAAVPVWSPDSSTVHFVRLAGGSSMEVWRATREGAGARKLADGSAVAVSPDGRVLVVRRDPTEQSLESGVVHVSRDGGPFLPVIVNGQPTAAAVTNDKIVVGMVDESGKTSLVTASLDGRGVKRLVGAPAGTVPAVWGELYVAPAGDKVAAVAVGDDGYSRVSAIALPAGTETKLSRRRDGYVRGWSADGAQLFLVEGNYFQGEPTALVRTFTDGTNRQPVVTGAE